METRTTCRLDGSRLRTILDLGEMYVSDFINPECHAREPFKAPLELVQGESGLVQLRHTVDPELMFRDYWYKSSTNPTMVRHLADLVQKILRLRLNPLAPVVVDIGCNDGTLLQQYPIAHRRIGFDPSKVKPQGPLTFINDFFSANAYWSTCDIPADVVTSIAMFYDLNDPVQFAKEVAEILAPDGLWLLELHYLPSMLSYVGYDAICHEHLCYYSLTTLYRVLQEAGFSIVDVELNNVNGGSMLVYAKKGQHQLSPTGRMLWEAEKDSTSLERFANRVEKNKQDLMELITDIHLSGQRIYGYGASTKGNTILQYCGLDESIVEGIADRNPDKWGRRTVGTDIPIVNEDEARANADYLLVLPYHFIDNFVEREADWLQAGGRFIVPCPNPYLI